LLEHTFQYFRHPLVIDADGLNVLAHHNWLLNKIPPNTILTPHPKEFERLFGKATDDFHRIALALEKAAFYKTLILLKGHYTFIATPGGIGYFNGTGNAGMATGGTGDVLTGIITSLLAQGYTPGEAAIAGAYIHGLAGDLAAAMVSQEAMVASDVIDNLGAAFSQLLN
jgi:ADP-dependent NAD(P)H-hydrate dehydratase / NAD(P)H-hydrate epimerase